MSSRDPPAPSCPASLPPDFLPITTEDYVDLIDWTARLTRSDKRGSVKMTEPPILRKPGLTERQWHLQMLGKEDPLLASHRNRSIIDRESRSHRTILAQGHRQCAVPAATTSGLI